MLHVVLEHQSQSDLDMPLRLLSVKLRLWEKQRKEKRRLSPVVPLVVSHGEPWSAPRTMLERLRLPEPIAGLVAPFTPQSTYVLDDLARFDPATLARRPGLTPHLRVTYFLLQRAREAPAFEEELGWILEDLTRLATEPGAKDFFVAFVRYTFLVASGDMEKVHGKLRDALDPSLEVEMGTIAEQLIARGEARGRAEGEARGRAEGEARGRCYGAGGFDWQDIRDKPEFLGIYRDLAGFGGSIMPPPLPQTIEITEDCELWDAKIGLAPGWSKLLGAPLSI